jgi:hypothetical protein
MEFPQIGGTKQPTASRGLTIQYHHVAAFAAPRGKEQDRERKRPGHASVLDEVGEEKE